MSKPSVIAQFLENVASGKAALAKANADLAASQTLNQEHEATITRLQADASSHAEALAAANTARAEAEASAAAANAIVTSFCSAVGLNVAELSGKKPEDFQAAFSARVQARATEQLAELGFDPNALPAAKSGEQVSASADLVAQYNALLASGDSRAAAEFYAKHKDQILS